MMKVTLKHEVVLTAEEWIPSPEHQQKSGQVPCMYAVVADKRVKVLAGHFLVYANDALIEVMEPHDFHEKYNEVKEAPKPDKDVLPPPPPPSGLKYDPKKEDSKPDPFPPSVPKPIDPPKPVEPPKPASGQP